MFNGSVLCCLGGIYEIGSLISLRATNNRDHVLHDSGDLLITMTLSFSEPPRVSLSVSSEVSLVVGGEQKVVCEAVGYYPLDVHMEWLKKSLSPGASRMPEVLKVDMYSSHRRHQDGTYSVSAFFLLQPTLQDSGYRYTCRVSHVALRVPIRKSFTLSVTGKPRICPV